MKKLLALLAALSLLSATANAQTWDVSDFRDVLNEHGVVVDIIQMSHVTATLNNGVMTISGTGNMANLSHTVYPLNPYYSHRNQITQVVVQNGVTGIGSYAFDDCTNLTSVTVPNNFTYIGSNAFNGCTSLTSIALPNNFVLIRSYAFYGCTSLTSVTFPSSSISNAVSIGEYAFANCTSLNVTLPSNIMAIDNNAFMNCTSLTEVTLCDQILYTSDNIFYGCTGLTRVTMQQGGMPTIGNGMFYGCSNLAEIIIPSGVSGIGNQAFYGCAKLTDITIRGSIGNQAFYGCANLTDITISSSSIGNQAFASCTKLASVTLTNSTPPTLGANAFQNVHASFCVTVPPNLYSVYNGNNSWKNYLCPPIKYTVTFNAMGGSAVPSQQVVAYSKATAPNPAPTRTGYTLEGWYIDHAYTGRWEFNADDVTGNITLYAKWTPINYTVTFKLNDGTNSNHAEQTVAYGSCASAPNPAPTREGFTFKGWYTSTDYTTLYNFNSAVTADITLFAKWKLDAEGSCTEGAQFVIKIPFRSLSPGDTVTYRWYRNGALIVGSQGTATSANTHITCTVPPNEAHGINVEFHFEYTLNDNHYGAWTPSPKYRVSFVP